MGLAVPPQPPLVLHLHSLISSSWPREEGMLQHGSSCFPPEPRILGGGCLTRDDSEGLAKALQLLSQLVVLLLDVRLFLASGAN